MSQAPISDAVELPEHLGPYRVLGILGRGGMGEVLLAHDPRLGRRVAIKRLRSDAASARFNLRMQDEARLTASLSHPAIVQIFDVLELDGLPHIVMELVAGRSLRRQIEHRGPLPPEHGLPMAHHLALGVACAHARGVVHRDLKTENVLLSEDGVAKITDFGIACSLARPGEPGEAAADAGQDIFGTLRAMSPEQLCGEPLDARTDLFSFGVLLYELFTGRSPFEAGSRQETLQRVVAHQPPPVHVLAPVLPAALGRLVAELLAKEPDQRPATMQRVAERLAEIAEHGDHLETRRTETAQRPSRGRPPVRWLPHGERRRPGLTILAHPEGERIGTRAELRELGEGEQVAISRLHPCFSPVGDASFPPSERRPLLESHLSRRPILLRWKPESGALVIDRAGSGTDLSIEGEAVASRAEIAASDLERGVVLVLSRRVALWLHLFDPHEAPLPVEDLARRSTWRPDDVARLFFEFLAQSLPALRTRSPVLGADRRPWPPPELIARVVRASWPGGAAQLREIAGKLAALGPQAAVTEMEELLREAVRLKRRPRSAGAR